jgi:hypothetical protein
MVETDNVYVVVGGAKIQRFDVVGALTYSRHVEVVLSGIWMFVAMVLVRKCEKSEMGEFCGWK